MLHDLRLVFFFFFPFVSVEGTRFLRPLSSCASFSQLHTHTFHIPVPLAPSCRYVTAVALSPTFPWIATGSMDRSVNVWRIGDGDDSTGKYSAENCLSWRQQMHNHSSFLKQTVSSGTKPRSHLQRQRFPKECFGSCPAREAPITCVLLSGCSV